MSWSGGPYQGPNGNSLFRGRQMHECCREFFGARQPSSPLSSERRVDLSEDSSAASLGPAVRQGSEFASPLSRHPAASIRFPSQAAIER